MFLKNIFAAISIICTLIFFLPYLRDMFRGTTKPHIYTWLIWSITQATAVAAIWSGGGGAGAWAFLASSILVFLIFLLSFKYGTKNITSFDTFILIIALLAIVIWWKFDSPALAVYMATGIDLLGFLPSYRKIFQDPWSETLISWSGSVVSYIFAIAALSEYNILTSTYFLAMILANILLILICLIQRKRKVPKISQHIH